MSGFGERLRGLLRALSATPDWARADRVAAVVPPDTDYVTVGAIRFLPDAWGFVGGTPGRQPYRHDFGARPDLGSEPPELGLLVLAGGRVGLFTEAGERWSVAAEQITDLDGHRHSGFVILTTGPTGLAVSAQTPVEVPPGVRWRTVARVANVFGGWDRELAAYGVRVHY